MKEFRDVTRSKKHATFLTEVKKMADVSEFGKEDFILLLDKGIIPGWWDKEAHKITYFIVSKLLGYAYEVNDKQEVSVCKASFTCT